MMLLYLIKQVINKEKNNETFGYHNFFEHYGLSARVFGIQLLHKSIGGGTSINWQTSLETPTEVLNEWDNDQTKGALILIHLGKVSTT